jgi:hypothetical protein
MQSSKRSGEGKRYWQRPAKPSEGTPESAYLITLRIAANTTISDHAVCFR